MLVLGVGTFIVCLKEVCYFVETVLSETGFTQLPSLSPSQRSQGTLDNYFSPFPFRVFCRSPHEGTLHAGAEYIEISTPCSISYLSTRTARRPPRFPFPCSANRKITSELFGGSRSGRGLRLDFFLPTRVSFPADIWEEVMGYRCHDACGLAAAAVAKVSGGALGAAGGVGSGSDDEDLDGAGDVEMGEFYSGAVVCDGVCVFMAVLFYHVA